MIEKIFKENELSSDLLNSWISITYRWLEDMYERDDLSLESINSSLLTALISLDKHIRNIIICSIDVVDRSNTNIPSEKNRKLLKKFYNECLLKKEKK